MNIRNSMKRQAGWVLLFLVLAGMLGCNGGGGETAAQALIVPGESISRSGEPLVSLGESLPDLRVRFGDKLTIRDLGGLGARFAVDDEQFSGMLSGMDGRATVISIDVAAGFNGLTAEGVGIGSDKAAVSAIYTAATSDPYLDASWALDVGLVLQWDQGAVSQIQIVAPR